MAAHSKCSTLPSPASRSILCTASTAYTSLGDQAILRWDGSSQNRHLGVFGAFLTVPGQRLNSAPYFFDTGVVAYGPTPRRPRDFAAMGIAYASYTALLRPAERAHAPPSLSIEQRNFESTIELTYGCAIKAGLVL